MVSNFKPTIIARNIGEELNLADWLAVHEENLQIKLCQYFS